MQRSPRLAGAPILALLLVAAGLPADSACNGSDDDDDHAGDDDVVDDDDTTSLPLTGTAAVQANPNNQFGAVVDVQLDGDGDADVIVEYGEGGTYGRATPPLTVSGGEPASILVFGLRAETAHQLRAVASSGDRSWTSETLEFTTAPLPDGWPSCAVTFGVDESTFTADEVVCTDGRLDDTTPVYYCVDRWGTPRWELRHPDDVWIRHVEVLSDGRLMATGYSDSLLAFFTPDGHMEREYSVLNFQDQTRFDHEWINQHDAIEITQGQWTGAVALMTNAVDFYDGTSLNGLGILVVDPDDGTVRWDWSVHGQRGDEIPIDPILDPARYGLYEESGVNWLHANGIVHGLDPDDGHDLFWISLRAQDWIIEVDASDDSIPWRLGYQGDFALVDDLDATTPVALDDNEWMFQQHAPAWLQRDGDRTRFVVFDNGNVRPVPLPPGGDPYSRVVEFEIDEGSMRATVNYSYGSAMPADPEHFFSNAYGDADLLPSGDALLFDVGLQDFFGGFLAEITYPGGVERWRYDCPGHDLYQLEYYPSLYEMTWHYP